MSAICKQDRVSRILRGQLESNDDEITSVLLTLAHSHYTLMYTYTYLCIAKYPSDGAFAVVLPCLPGENDQHVCVNRPSNSITPITQYLQVKLNVY
jgi:hypothetical protein